MISAAQARAFAVRHFPEAPEKLVRHLGVTLRRSPMDGCDGWCLTSGTKTIIRINSKLPRTRQRFTLAHELGHLILGVPTIVGESVTDMLGSDSDEERKVNDLAAELLIPVNVVKDSLPELPVVTMALRKLARKANVSELSAAIRVCNLATQIGLENASVVWFDSGDRLRWQWSKTLRMKPATAVRLLKGARAADPQAFRESQSDGKVVVASTIENAYFGSATLFVQLLPPEIGMRLSRHERRKSLERELFAADVKLQQRMAGCFGAIKNRMAGKTAPELEAEFWERYHETLASTPLNSSKGREYVRLRVEALF